MTKSIIAILLLVLMGNSAEIITFADNWGKNPLFNLVSETPNGVEIIFSVHNVVIEERIINGVPVKYFGVPGIFLPNEEGAPNLAGTCRYITLPQEAQAQLSILNTRAEVYHDIEIEPAPNIPLETDNTPLRYIRNMEIYGRDAYYPQEPVKLIGPLKIRGVDVVLLGVMPFQYNPVTKDLIIYKDLHIKINFINGNGHFGEDRLRSRFWEPILQNHLLNYNSLPEIDFYAPERISGRNGYEYIIIVPNDPVFEAWGDTIKIWRKLQGISSEVFTLNEVGGSDSATIKNFLQNAYNTWNPAPVAFLLLSDYPTSGKGYGITSPSFSYSEGRYVADNWYADFTGDRLPELHHGRICAQDAEDLRIMVNKFLSYERNPYTAANFYNQPLVAAAWQGAPNPSPRWFQICGEVIRGFFINVLGKNPARQYAIYAGNVYPGCAWSTASGTATVVNYWNSFGYIPLVNPYDAAWWSNGSPSGITAAINSGAFMVQHRDHGGVTGWGEPAYNNGDLNNLTNTMFTFVNSSNCLTGQYNFSSECFTEKFHRIEHGALGLNAASQTSYSFYNDTYVWGIFDGLWPQFDPGYPLFGMAMTGSNDLRPCMAMTNGKYYLQASSWVSGGSGKIVTYGLFHHHGDVFTTLYSEVPQNLSVSHASSLTAGQTSFSVTANSGSVIGLTVNKEIIGVAEATGAPVNIPITQQLPGSTMKITITKANYYRYEADVPIIPSNYPYIMLGTAILNDADGNGQANPGENIEYGVYARNIGIGTAQSVYGLLSEADPYVTVNIDSSWYGNILENDSSLSNPYYSFSLAYNCPDSHVINLNFEFIDINDTICTTSKNIMVFAPVITHHHNTIMGGDGNGVLNIGENANLVATIKNEGSAQAENTTGTLTTTSSYITIHSDASDFGTIAPDDTTNNISNPFNIEASPSTPPGEVIDFKMTVSAGGYIDTVHFSITVSAVGIEEGRESKPAQTMLTKVHPNPFSKQIEVFYQLAELTQVDLEIYDASGRLVRRLIDNQIHSPGYYTITWNGIDNANRKLAAGIYFVKFTNCPSEKSIGYSQIEKLVLLE